ncbi:CxxxxCH/CxxCH domain-containing protein [Bradyrhizobium sp. WD16]|uniref:CxxxxCH/CxxCH domain-containing protein n=1 Tax=Bradyrhizobium sp. WD16 TaxID=1521768 RepID=UPI00220D421F|nr:hypothetical protein DB459_22980 [Bradyrhizobium sp. WD16]
MSRHGASARCEAIQCHQDGKGGNAPPPGHAPEAGSRKINSPPVAGYSSEPGPLESA